VPTWGEILKEIEGSRRPDLPLGDLDGIRRKYLQVLNRKTGRNTVIYASGWQQNRPNVPPSMLTIVGEDVQGFMEAFHGIVGRELDLIIHSPGGDLAAAEAIVQYVRTRFDDVRVIVPGEAMSAACLIACSANRIIMASHSFLGPIDPQLTINTSNGPRMCAAHAILEQFEQAKRECANQSNLVAWLPMLSQFGPDLLVACKNAISLSKTLAKDWLATYMFSGRDDGTALSESISSWLSNHSEMMTHGRHLSRRRLQDQNLIVDDLEDDQELQDAVLSVYHCFSHLFAMSPMTKIIENHHGKAFMKMQPLVQAQVVQFGLGGPFR
jgi:Serine dehydrogenase proteinase